MFESILIRRHVLGGQLVDAGTIAEILLFYEHVHVVADRGLLFSILKVIGPDNLLIMLDRNMISLTYVRDSLAVLTKTSQSGIQFHDIVAYRLGGKKTKLLSKNEDVEETVERALGKSGKTKRFARHLLDRISFRNLVGTKESSNEIPALVREDLKDADFVKKAVQHIIRTILPTMPLPAAWTFDVVFASDGSFIVGTNLNFDKMNEEYHKVFSPEHSSLNPAFLLSSLSEARIDAYFAAEYMAELVSTPVSAGIIGEKFSQLLSKRGRSVRQIELFQNLILDDARAIKEAINSGEKTFTEFLELMDRAQKFKKWLGSRNPDVELLRDYYKSTTAASWVDKLPSKSLRFVLATLGGFGADMLFPTGGLGTALGVGMGATDSLLLDRLLRGWRPNQFVEGELRRFLSR